MQDMQYFQICIFCTELLGCGPQYIACLIKFALTVNREVVLGLPTKVYGGNDHGVRREHFTILTCIALLPVIDANPKESCVCCFVTGYWLVLRKERVRTVKLNGLEVIVGGGFMFYLFVLLF